jgi:hypothetical protein
MPLRLPSHDGLTRAQSAGHSESPRLTSRQRLVMVALCVLQSLLRPGMTPRR